MRPLQEAVMRRAGSRLLVLALTALAHTRPIEAFTAPDWRALAAQVDADPHAFLAQLTRTGDSTYAPMLEWSLADSRAPRIRSSSIT